MSAPFEGTDTNFVDVAFWQGDEVIDCFNRLRDGNPIYWSEETELWMITGYEEAQYVSKNQDVFTSVHGVRPKEDTIIGLIDEPEPRHGQLRRLINRGFTPRMVKILEKDFRRITREALDEMSGQAEFDFVDAFSVPLPIRLIARMIGIEEEDRDRFHAWSDDLIASNGNQDAPEIMARTAKAFMEYSGYVSEIIEERRKRPQDDLISVLVNAKDSGVLDKEFTDERILSTGEATEEYVAMANDELIVLLVVLMVAGNETTRNAISGGMQLLIENPGERQKLLEDPSKITAAVEEMVRLVSPVRTFSRTLTQDYELSGHAMSKGQEVCIVYPAANRDPRVYEDPDVFKVDRNPQHLGFGVGSHFCLGANLARMEMRVAFEELLSRFPDLEYSRGGPEFRPSTLVRSCVHMWLKPAGAAQKG